MEMVCPDCLGTLEAHTAGTVRCRIHGGEYKILFARFQPPTPAPPLAAAPAPIAPGEIPPVIRPAADATCRNHPKVQASFFCRDCGVSICETCAFTEPGGAVLCPECMSRRPAAPLTAPGFRPPAPAPAIRPGTVCAQHPNVAATQQCRACGAFMCPTCDFPLPGEIHICPKCAAAPKSALSPKRKKLMLGSYALAAWSTLGMIALFAGVFGRSRTKADEEAVGIILTLFVLFPAVIGLGLGLAARERRLVNPPALWITIVWNGIMVGSFLLLCIVGILMKSA